MRQLVIVAAGCFPLFWLTAANLRDWQRAVKMPAAVSEPAHLDLGSKRDHASRASENAFEETSFANAMIKIEPFENSLRATAFAKSPALFEHFAESWQQYAEAHKVVSAVVDVYPDGRRALLEEEKDGLRKIVELVADPKEKELKNWCEARLREIKGDEELKGKLKEIRSFFEKNNYDAALSRLDQLPREQLSTDESREMKGIAREARFKRHWKDFPRAPVPPVPADARRRMEKLKKLLDDSRSLSMLDGEDEEVESRKTYINDREKELDELRCRIKIDELFDKQFSSFANLARESVPIVQEYGTQTKLQERLKEWVKDRLPVKNVPNNKYQLTETEAWALDGTYMRGVFKKCNGFNAREEANRFYHYWKDPTAAKNGLTFENEVYAKDLMVQPREMLEIQLCRAYNERRGEALKSFGSKRSPREVKDEWQNFATFCDETRQQISEYYSKVKLEKRDLSLQLETELTDEIMKEWDIVVKIYYPD